MILLKCMYCVTEFDAKLQKYNKENNPVGAFSCLCFELSVLFEQENFAKLQKVCSLTGAGCSREFKKEIQAAKSSNDILNVLDDSLYCNWLNTEYLKMIVINAGMHNAEEHIKLFEECFHTKQVSVVRNYIKDIYFNPVHVENVKLKINKSDKNLTVRNLLDFCRALETNMGIPTGSLTPAGPVESGCLLLACAIPLHCSLHSYEMAKLNFFKFRKLHIQFVHVESYPKIFTFSLFTTAESLPTALPKGKYSCTCYLFIASVRFLCLYIFNVLLIVLQVLQLYT